MALIAPSSKVYFLQGIPFDREYKHTTKFATKSAQETYFLGKKKYEVERCTYLRVEQKLSVPILADLLYNCPYLMFQNSGYGSKWFYAFITGVEYVNDNTTNVTYELDVYQTWQFDIDFKPSFVEREHTTVDTIGYNLVPEQLEIGDYKYTDLGVSTLFSLYQIVVASTFKMVQDTFVSANGGMYGGVYSGLHYNVFSSFVECNRFLQRATEENKSDGIVSIFMLPIAFCYDYQETQPESFNLNRDKQYTHIDGYVPKNKKLFTYPYNTLYVTNNEGQSANYPFEYFTTNDCNFKVTGAMCCTPEVMLTPKNYKGVSENYNESITVGNFPQCAYSIDTFRAFVAQNGLKMVAETGMNVARIVGGGATAYATGGVLGASEVVGGLTGIMSTLTTLEERSTRPPQARGNQSSIINMANEIKGFQFYYAYIRAEFAKIIDDFFTMFGYATHRVKVPNINTRPVFNYVKTVDAVITGDVPTDDLTKIRNMFNRGVTLWRNPDNLGNYELNNSI